MFVQYDISPSCPRVFIYYLQWCLNQNQITNHWRALVFRS